MGKGDKRSKRGKIWKGTFGVSRPRVKTDAYVGTTKEVVEEVSTEKPAAKTAAKKTAAKKAPAKKATAKKAPAKKASAKASAKEEK